MKKKGSGLVYDKNKFKTPGKYIEYLQMLAQDVVWYNTPISTDEGDTENEIGDFIPDTGPTIEELTENSDRREILIKYIDYLPPREAFVLKLRYGFLTGRSMTLDEVGKTFKVTRERVRQIEAKALKRLKHKMITSGIRKGDI